MEREQIIDVEVTKTETETIIGAELKLDMDHQDVKVMSPRIIPGTEMPDNVQEVVGSGSNALRQMAEASVPHQLVKKFKERESFMRNDGTMMERDVFYVIPSAAMSHPNPENYALGLQYGQEKPQGRLFAGKNRHERRSMGKTKRISY